MENIHRSEPSTHGLGFSYNWQCPKVYRFICRVFYVNRIVKLAMLHIVLSFSLTDFVILYTIRIYHECDGGIEISVIAQQAFLGVKR